MRLTSRIIYSTLVVIGLIALFFTASPVRAEVKPGDVIDKSNYQKALDVIPPHMEGFFTKDGLVMKVVANKDYPYPPAYVEATKKYSGMCKVENGCFDYVAGQPFPDINLNDPQAGTKVAYNNMWKLQNEQTWYDPLYFDLIRRDGLERRLEGKHGVCRVQGRVLRPPIKENPEKIHHKEYMQFFNPKDVSGVGFMGIKYIKEGKDDDAYAYVPALRRVRRMSGSQRTDAYMGSDFKIEDFYGFNGKVGDFKWKLTGKKKMLTPIDIKPMGPNKYGPIWHMGKDTEYQLRDHWVVEVQCPPGHPYGKRLLYFDTQWYLCTWALGFDKKGEIWNNFISGLRWMGPENTFDTPGAVCIDIQADHGSAATDQGNQIGDTEHTPNWYAIDTLEKGGH